MTLHRDAKFVIFTAPRSGSEWLTSMLNSLPNVTAQGELFLGRPRPSEQRWDSDFACPRYIESKPTGLPFRPFSVFSYLEHLYGSPGIVGFKLMYYQLRNYPEILMYLMRRRIRVIHLVRRNHLDVVLSIAIKAKIGRAHLLEGQSRPDDMQVELNTQNLIARLGRLEKAQNLSRKLLRGFRLSTIEVGYEDLTANPDNFNALVKFLSIVPEDAKPRSAIVKTRRGKQKEVISNYEQVRAILINSKYAGLLE